ncbi:TIGR02391 family protein [Defluviimonas sp. SAOS-178_SWC]|uniref:TIGR02391 family protein n=1 Tax=Defluviimonas sp. SAOS-178_SWC TaxID=3121287 RepID=UPI00322203B7
MIEQIKKFQAFLVELGVARNVLALPAPRMLAIEDHTSDDSSGTTIFSHSVVEPEIVNVSRDLFASGHYNLAVSNAFLALDKLVAERSGLNQSGTTLMDQAFSPAKPKLRWSNRITQSEKDEQRGYHQIYSGSMLGIRNPTTHEFDWVDSPELALELLMLAQHLVRKAKLAVTEQTKPTTA